MTDPYESSAAAVCISLLIVYLLNEMTGNTVAPSLLLFAGIGVLILAVIFRQQPE